MKKIITARFRSACAETGAKIAKGENMLYDYSAKKCYCAGAVAFKNFVASEEADREARAVAGYIQAQEDACFENQWRG